MFAFRIDHAIDDHRCRAFAVAGVNTGDSSHVTVLASNACAISRRCAVLVPYDFEFDAGRHGDLVAAHTKVALRELLKMKSTGVNGLGGVGVSGVRFDFEKVFVRDGSFVPRAIAAAVNWLEDIARLDPSLAVGFCVSLVDAMACNASYAFAKDTWAVVDGLVARMFHRGCDRRVASHAKVTDRAAGEFVDRVFESVKHWRDACVSMARCGPFVVNLLVALGTFGGGWELRLCVNFRVRVGSGGCGIHVGVGDWRFNGLRRWNTGMFNRNW